MHLEGILIIAERLKSVGEDYIFSAFLYYFLRHRILSINLECLLSVYSRLAWKSPSSCLSFLGAGIAGVYYHTQLQGMLLTFFHLRVHFLMLVMPVVGSIHYSGYLYGIQQCPVDSGCSVLILGLTWVRNQNCKASLMAQGFQTLPRKQWLSPSVAIFFWGGLCGKDCFTMTTLAPNGCLQLNANSIFFGVGHLMPPIFHYLQVLPE